MLTEIQAGNIVENETDFHKIVQFHVTRVALMVAQEDPGTANHAARILLAPKILHDPTGWMRLFSYGVITDSTVLSRSGTQDVFDHPGDVSDAVESLFDFFAL